jgi:hypothetical protein
MKQIEHLKLRLWHVIREAATAPEEMNWQQLWQALEATLLGLNSQEQLQVIAEAIVQIVQVFHERSNLTFEDLQALAAEDGPVMSEDAFDRYVRQTMEVDFDQFIEAPVNESEKLALPQKREFPDDGRSIVAAIDKSALLDALEPEVSLSDEEAYHQAISVAHGENIEKWIEAIVRYLQSRSEQAISLLELVQGVDYSDSEPDGAEQHQGNPLVQTWLALLLGGYSLEQRGSFYQPQGIWVTSRVADPSTQQRIIPKNSSAN